MISSEKQYNISDLKPCPFCGGTAKITEHAFPGWTTDYSVLCTNCKASVYKFFETEEQAAEAWNNRI